MLYTARLLRSKHTSEKLRSKLRMCGSKTADGYVHHCRSVGCDYCRRYRAAFLAEAVADWSSDVVATHQIMIIEMVTDPYATPDEMLDGVARARRALTRAYDYRQRRDDRFRHVQSYASYSPVWFEGLWVGRMSGVIHLASITAERYAATVGASTGVTLRPLSSTNIRGEISQVLTRTFYALDGLESCDDEAVASIFEAIELRGERKCLIARRKM